MEEIQYGWWARSREEAGRLVCCAPARAFPADPAVPETSSQLKWWGPHDEAVGMQKGPPATATLDELGYGWVTDCEQLEMERSGRWRGYLGWPVGGHLLVEALLDLRMF